MTAAAVFTKTELGRQELINRSGKLTPRQRRVLIFIDGKHTVEDLREMAAADDLSHTLGMLEEEGFIELAGVLEGDDTIVPSSGPLPSISSFQPIPEVQDAKRFEMAKNFMINTIKMFCGGYAHLTLQSNVNEATSHAQLREYFDLWYHAIVDTREGRRRGEELRENLLKII